MFYFIGWSLFLIFFKFYLGFTVIGRENVPKRGAFIFASNHSSYFDPPLLGTSVYRSLNYMAQEDLFKVPFLGWALRRVHSFPVARDESDFAAIRQSLKLLDAGKPLVIFPEGGRSQDGSLKTGKPGIGFIAAKSGVAVVPAYISGSFKALPKGMKTLRRHPVSVYIGKPVYFGKNEFGAKGRGAYQAISDKIMERIAELKREHEGEVG